MPHFKDGTEAKVGDHCRFQTERFDPEERRWVPVMREGLIFDILPSPQTCNAQVVYPSLETHGREDGQTRIVKLCYTHVALGECEKAA